jgi:hypothetical protein
VDAEVDAGGPRAERHERRPGREGGPSPRPAARRERREQPEDRLRGEANSYNVVRVRGAAVEVELRALAGDRFAPAGASRFVRTGQGWAAITAPAALGAPPP